jgi:hypothetical protein
MLLQRKLLRNCKREQSLSEAGVVDAGGYGFVAFFKGCLGFVDNPFCGYPLHFRMLTLLREHSMMLKALPTATLQSRPNIVMLRNTYYSRCRRQKKDPGRCINLGDCLVHNRYRQPYTCPHTFRPADVVIDNSL